MSSFVPGNPFPNRQALVERDSLVFLMRFQGMECNAPGAHAEDFYCRK